MKGDTKIAKITWLRKLYATRIRSFQAPKCIRGLTPPPPSKLNVIGPQTNFGAFDDVRESRASSAIIHASNAANSDVQKSLSLSLFLHSSFPFSLSPLLYLAQNHTAQRVCAIVG